MGNAIGDPPQNGGTGGVSNIGGIMPEMVLIVEAVMWRGLDAAVEDVGTLGGRVGDFVCVVLLDGMELGRAVSFPLGPVLVNPSSEESQLVLRLIARRPDKETRASDLVEEQAGSEVVVPVNTLAKFGAPLYTSLWLGVPVIEHVGPPATLPKAIHDSRNPEVPKICITLFRPAKTPPNPSGSLCGLQPDVHSLFINEAWDDCTVPRLSRGPNAVQQVEGVLESLKLANATMLALQDRLPLGVQKWRGYRRSAEPFLWRFDAGDEKSVKIRKAPHVNAAPAGASMQPGDVFKVSQEQMGVDGVRYLRLADGRGWLFDKKPGVAVLCHRLQDPPLTMFDLDLSNSNQDMDVSFRGSLLALSRATFPGDPDIARSLTSLMQDSSKPHSTTSLQQTLGAEDASLQLARVQEELAAVRAELRACQASEAQAQKLLQDQTNALNDMVELQSLQMQNEAARGLPGAAGVCAADLLGRALNDLQAARNTPHDGEISPRQLEQLRHDLDTWGVMGSAPQIEIDTLNQKLVQAQDQIASSLAAEGSARALLDQQALEVNRLRQQLNEVSGELERGRATPQQPAEGPSALERELELLREELAYYKANEKDAQHGQELSRKSLARRSTVNEDELWVDDTVSEEQKRAALAMAERMQLKQDGRVEADRRDPRQRQCAEELGHVQGQLVDALAELQEGNSQAALPPVEKAGEFSSEAREEMLVLKQQLAAAVAELAAVRSQTERGEQSANDHQVQILREELAAAFQEIDRCHFEGGPVQLSDTAEIGAEFGAALQELEAYQVNERNRLLLQQELEDQLVQSQGDMEALYAKAEHHVQENHHLREELALIATEGAAPQYKSFQESFAHVQDELHCTLNENAYLREEVIALGSELTSCLGPDARELRSEVTAEGQGIAAVSVMHTQDVGSVTMPHAGPMPP